MQAQGDVTPFASPCVCAVAHLDAKEKADVIRSLARELAIRGVLDDQEAFERSVFEREGSGGTVVSDSTAFPHGVGSSVRQFGIAAATLARPVVWDAGESGAALVDFVALFAVPDAACEHGSDEYVRALGAVADAVDDPSVRSDFFEYEESAALAAALESCMDV